MFCHKCGTQNLDTAKYCIQCGTELLRVPEAASSAGPAVSLGGWVARQRARGWPISGACAVLVLICFFLPWISVSCGSEQILEVSGQELAAGFTFFGEKAPGQPVLWLTLLAALICLIIAGAAYSKGRMSRGGAVGQILLTAVGLIAMLVVYLNLRPQPSESDEWLEGLVTLSTEIGLWGTFLGYLGIVAGAILDLRPAQE